MSVDSMKNIIYLFFHLSIMTSLRAVTSTAAGAAEHSGHSNKTTCSHLQQWEGGWMLSVYLQILTMFLCCLEAFPPVNPVFSCFVWISQNRKSPTISPWRWGHKNTVQRKYRQLLMLRTDRVDIWTSALSEMLHATARTSPLIYSAACLVF